MRTILADSSLHWHQQRSAHFVLHFTDGSAAEGHAERLLARAEMARTDNLRLLGASSFAPPIHLFFVGSRGDYERITGGTGTGWTIPQAQSIVFLMPPGAGNPEDRHEIMHVLSLNLWGLNPARDMWLREGLGVYATERCAPGAIDSTARAMLADGRARPLDTYRANFFVPGIDHLPAYMLSASFVKFLLERRGRARLRALWERGSEALPHIYGSTAEALEAEWKKRLASDAAASVAHPRPIERCN